MEPEPPVSRIWEISKHPLLLLTVGTLLGSFVIPYVNARIDRDRRRLELKSQRATTILQSAWNIDRKLNLVLTEFATFHRDRVTTGSTTSSSKEALRSRVYTLYEDFNRDAWWWHWQVLEEAKILGLVDDGSRAQLEQAVQRYHDALLDSTAELDKVWTEFIRNPGTPRPETAAKTINEAMFKLKALSDRRQSYVRLMIEAILR